MTQEELKLLKELLEKAKQLTNRQCNEFDVVELRRGELSLRGYALAVGEDFNVTAFTWSERYGLVKSEET